MDQDLEEQEELNPPLTAYEQHHKTLGELQDRVQRLSPLWKDRGVIARALTSCQAHGEHQAMDGLRKKLKTLQRHLNTLDSIDHAKLQELEERMHRVKEKWKEIQLDDAAIRIMTRKTKIINALQNFPSSVELNQLWASLETLENDVSRYAEAVESKRHARVPDPEEKARARWQRQKEKAMMKQQQKKWQEEEEASKLAERERRKEERRKKEEWTRQFLDNPSVTDTVLALYRAVCPPCPAIEQYLASKQPRTMEQTKEFWWQLGQALLAVQQLQWPLYDLANLGAPMIVTPSACQHHPVELMQNSLPSGMQSEQIQCNLFTISSVFDKIYSDYRVDVRSCLVFGSMLDYHFVGAITEERLQKMIGQQLPAHSALFRQAELTSYQLEAEQKRPFRHCILQEPQIQQMTEPCQMQSEDALIATCWKYNMVVGCIQTLRGVAMQLPDEWHAAFAAWTVGAEYNVVSLLEHMHHLEIYLALLKQQHDESKGLMPPLFRSGEMLQAFCNHFKIMVKATTSTSESDRQAAKMWKRTMQVDIAANKAMDIAAPRAFLQDLLSKSAQ